jgi:hypothetical protein
MSIMMTPVEAIRSGAGFDQAGRWHRPRVLYMPARRRDDDPMAPARGAIYGLLASGFLWMVLFLAVRILRSLL